MVKIQQCRRGCGREIYVAFSDKDNKWLPFDASTHLIHDCPQYHASKDAASSTPSSGMLQQPIHIQGNAILSQQLTTIASTLTAMDEKWASMIEIRNEKAHSDHVNIFSMSAHISIIEEKIKTMEKTLDDMMQLVTAIKKDQGLFSSAADGRVIRSNKKKENEEVVIGDEEEPQGNTEDDEGMLPEEEEVTEEDDKQSAEPTETIL